MPKFKQMLFAWPICRYPLGSGGKRVAIALCFFSAKSFSMIWRIKLLDSGAEAGAEEGAEGGRLKAIYTP